MQAPCKDCPDRFVGCHSQCEKYIAFRKYRDDLLEYKKKQQQLLDDFFATSRHTRKNGRRRPYGDSRGNQ